MAAQDDQAPDLSLIKKKLYFFKNVTDWDREMSPWLKNLLGNQEDLSSNSELPGKYNPSFRRHRQEIPMVTWLALTMWD